jgi:hypothetical protein
MAKQKTEMLVNPFWFLTAQEKAQKIEKAVAKKLGLDLEQVVRGSLVVESGPGWEQVRWSGQADWAPGTFNKLLEELGE